MKDYTVLSKLIKNNKFNGSVLISKDHKVVFKEGFGYANFEHNILNKPDTPMRIASITKTFTAVAVLKLYEEGKLDLNDPVSEYLEHFVHKDITIHHLLANCSGIDGFELEMDFYDITTSDNLLKTLINVFKDKPLLFPTGSKFGYSISGYLVLQYIIEKVTKTTYKEYLNDVIFDVLDMSNTYFEEPTLIIPNRGNPYSQKDGEVINSQFFDMRIAGAGGGLISSVNDLHKFNNGLLKNKLTAKKYVDMIFGNQIKITDNDYYGYGMVLNYGERRKRYYHPGGGVGVRSFNTFYPDDGLTVIIISNLDDKEIFTSTRTVIDNFLLQ